MWPSVYGHRVRVRTKERLRVRSKEVAFFSPVFKAHGLGSLVPG